MKIVIAGGTGFLGAPLAEMYAEEGHDVRVLTRSLMSGDTRHDPGTGVPGITRVGWKPDGTSGPWAAAVEAADAVVNLAGESVAGARWTPQRKALLRDSRLLPTRSLAAAIASAAHPPPVFISGSAVGYYGPSGAEPKKEDAPPGSDFLAVLCQDWEAEARRVVRHETRVVLLRTGIALERSGGALPQMIRPFRFFAGGPLGSGRQYVSWIHRLDWVEIVRWIVQSPDAAGPINATAPCPVTNRELARAIGRALRRPSFVPVPAPVLTVALGEMAGSILTGQRVLPARAQQLGYQFRYPEIDQAFRGIFGD
ncbi:MAG TPA: TIGR01777 family oxidoreductase [Vicinamibacterales bacterium]|nr:TIGR01777 family oxidoreductase [Vicinamibacterales bacterium]